MWVSNHTLVTNSGRAEEEPKWREGEPQLACSVYRQTKTDLVSICLRRLRPVVCCRRSKPLRNKLPWLTGGIHRLIEKTWNGLSRHSLRHQDGALTQPLSANPMLSGWHVYSEITNASFFRYYFGCSYIYKFELTVAVVIVKTELRPLYVFHLKLH